MVFNCLITMQNFRALYHVALLSLSPPIFKLPPCCYYQLLVGTTNSGIRFISVKFGQLGQKFEAESRRCRDDYISLCFFLNRLKLTSI
jgi:hypothetical protein